MQGHDLKRWEAILLALRFKDSSGTLVLMELRLFTLQLLLKFFQLLWCFGNDGVKYSPMRPGPSDGTALLLYPCFFVLQLLPHLPHLSVVLLLGDPCSIKGRDEMWKCVVCGQERRRLDLADYHVGFEGGVEAVGAAGVPDNPQEIEDPSIDHSC